MPGDWTWAGAKVKRTSTPDHVVSDISFTAERMFVECIDGERFEANNPGALERRWDAHRGLVQQPSEQAVAARYIPSNDDELLHAFFQRITNARGLNPRSAQPDSEPAAEGETDAAFALLSQLADMAIDCICATRPVSQCPNYMPGDEVIEEGDDE